MARQWNRVAKVLPAASARYDTAKRRANSIMMGPRELLRCTCGGEATYTHTELDVDGAGSSKACVHIRALYTNGAVKSEYSERGNQWSSRGIVYKVWLTNLGKKLFSWRYAARSL